MTGRNSVRQNSVPVRSTLTAVSFADDKNGWAVGQWGVIIATVDGGETWQLQRSDTSVDQPFFSVYFKDKTGLGSGAVVTDAGDERRGQDLGRGATSRSAGRKCRPQLPQNLPRQQGALFVAAEQGTVLRSGDGSGTWTFMKTGYKGSFWTGITLKNGTILVGGLRGTIYRSTDDGRSWKTSSGVNSSITDFIETGGKVVGVGLDGISDKRMAEALLQLFSVVIEFRSRRLLLPIAAG